MAKPVFKRKPPMEPLISCIDIEKLFGSFTYSLKANATLNPESGRLMLLYGENGSGKTTILNLLYHLLHPEPYGGHRSYVGSIPFKTIRIHLFNGASVTAYRLKNVELGDYKIKITSQMGNIRWTWKSDRKHKGDSTDPEYLKLCSLMENFGLSFHFLRDSRRVEGSSIPSEQQRFSRRIRRASGQILIDEGIDEDQESILPEKQLINSIENAVHWFRQRALEATNIGYTSVNTIYKGIIKSIVKPSRSPDNPIEITTEDLALKLSELEERNSSFARFGLTPELDLQEIVSTLKGAMPNHLQLLNTVLVPYLDGHSARLEALQELQCVMSSFVSLLNGFYSHKRASLHIEEGLHIDTNSGQPLEPTKLSSGEKQLLLLFCNAISSRREKTVLMIDEPEISLNVKWQRELIPALLTCMVGTNFQIILATHSVELLSQYVDSVATLENLNGNTDV